MKWTRKKPGLYRGHMESVRGRSWATIERGECTGLWWWSLHTNGKPRRFGKALRLRDAKADVAMRTWA